MQRLNSAARPTSGGWVPCVVNITSAEREASVHARRTEEGRLISSSPQHNVVQVDVLYYSTASHGTDFQSESSGALPGLISSQDSNPWSCQNFAIHCTAAR